jgi:hypothetical protein
VETLSLTDLAFAGLVVSGLCAEVLSPRRAGARPFAHRSLAGTAVAVVHPSLARDPLATARTSDG